MSIAINLNIFVDNGNEEKVTQIVETLTRVSTGLAFDGIDCTISISNFELEDDSNGSQ